MTVLARGAADSDAAATMIANAVNVDDPAILRRRACDLDPDSDLGKLDVTVEVGPLPDDKLAAALDAGKRLAESLIGAGLIEGALISLAGHWESCRVERRQIKSVPGEMPGADSPSNDQYLRMIG